MNDGLQALNLHSLIKSTLLRNILHDLEVDLRIWMRLLQKVCFSLRADSCGYLMSMLK